MVALGEPASEILLFKLMSTWGRLLPCVTLSPSSTSMVGDSRLFVSLAIVGYHNPLLLGLGNYDEW